MDRLHLQKIYQALKRTLNSHLSVTKTRNKQVNMHAKMFSATIERLRMQKLSINGDRPRKVASPTQSGHRFGN